MFRSAARVIAVLWLASGTSAFANGLREWSVRPLDSTNDLYAVGFGDGKFVAVGQGVVFVSLNGIEWQNAISPTRSTLRGIAYGAGMFVTVGDDGTILTSANAAEWTPQASGVTDDLIAIAYGGGQFVVVGVPEPNSQSPILTSPDGVTWTRRESGSRDPLLAVAYGNGKFVTVGHLSALASTEGIEWTAIALPNYSLVYGISYGNGRFVTAANDVYTPRFPFSVSEDGDDWVSTSAGTEGTASGITFAAGIFAAVGEMTFGFVNPTNQIAVSADGEHWVTYAVDLIPALHGIAYGAGRFVAVGLSGTIVESGPVTQPRLFAERIPQNQTIRITLTGDAGCTYSLEVSTNLSSSNWSRFVTVTNNSGVVSVTDVSGPNGTLRFYRAATQ